MSYKLLNFKVVIILCVVLLGSCSSLPVYTEAEKQKIISEAAINVDQRGDWRKIIELYKKLTEFDPVDSPARKKTIRYLLDENLRLVNEGKGEEALEFALELDKLIPNDFYVQNRILGAYRMMAEAAIEKKDWDTAYGLLYEKALSLRFDADVMRTYLNMRILMAKEEASKKNYDIARTYLAEIISIANIEENKALFSKEFAEAEKLLKSLS